MYRVTLRRLDKSVAFETLCFQYPIDSTLEHIMGQTDEDCFVDICRLREVECEAVDVEFDQRVSVEIGRWN